MHVVLLYTCACMCVGISTKGLTKTVTSRADERLMEKHRFVSNTRGGWDCVCYFLVGHLPLSLVVARGEYEGRKVEL